MSRKDYINIPKGNSIPFVKIEQGNDISLFENEENLFDSEDLVVTPYSNDVLYQKKDKPCLQIKSNLSTLEVYLRKEDETQQQVVMSKKSNNLDKFKKMDCIAYPHSSGRLAIYFEQGDVYDENNVVLSSYSLNGNLPEFAQIGNYVQIDSIGLLEISTILIDRDINKKVIIFEQAYAIAGNTLTIAACNYDLINFEVYEKYFNFNELDEGYYDIYVKGTSSTGIEYEYLSENILILDKHPNTFAIHYYNEDNKNLFYKYKLINQLRQRYSDFERYNKDENEININDDKSNLIKSSLNFGYKFVYERLNLKESDILSIALSSENVFINGIGFIKDGTASPEKLENTNVYKFECDMLKTNTKLSLTNPRHDLIDLLIPSTIPNI